MKRLGLLLILGLSACLSKEETTITPLNSAIPQTVQQTSGKSLFIRQCLQCHGSGAKGTAVAAFKLYERESMKDKNMFLLVLKNGKSGTFMKSFESRLTQAEMNLIWDYLQQLKQESTNANNGNRNE
ncbi:MAG: cytochrome c [Bacteriovoracaceae bacterium]|nr:cytochrome c [Bacteriovoracaceae bacterium]